MTITLIEDAEALTLCKCGARITVEAETCRPCQRVAIIDPPKQPKGIRKESFREDKTFAELGATLYRAPTPLRRSR